MIWKTLAKWSTQAVISGAGLELGRRALHGAFDRVGWQSPKDVEQDQEMKELREELTETKARQHALETELKALRQQLNDAADNQI